MDCKYIIIPTAIFSSCLIFWLALPTIITTAVNILWIVTTPIVEVIK